MKTGKTIYLRKNITPGDTMTLKSLMMLPEPVIRFSTIELPSTNILDKADLGHNYFLLYRFLKRSMEIRSHKITDLTKEVNYEKMEKDINDSIFSEIHEFFLGDEVVEENKFHKFLEVIVPKTRYLIRLMSKYLKDKLSFLDVVKQLEPFMIYPADISYKQYMEIRFVIKKRIEELKQEIEKKSGEYSSLRNAKFSVSQVPDPLLRLISENGKYSESFYKAYEFLGKIKGNKIKRR
jgi:hypothetical protein